MGSRDKCMVSNYEDLVMAMYGLYQGNSGYLYNVTFVLGRKFSNFTE